MSRFRYLIRPLVVVTLVATAVSLAATTTSAQDLTVFRFTNTEANDSDWEVRISVESLGGCGEATGHGSASSDWLEATDEWGSVLDLECSYVFTAVARNDVDERGKVCDAVLVWGSGAPDQDELRTRDSARSNETDVSVRHKGPQRCDTAIVAAFSIDPEDVVQTLPASATDKALEARAERAVEVAKFKVNVRPEQSTKNSRGCNQTFSIELSGGTDGDVERSLPGIPEGSSCKFRATVSNPPGPFNVVNTDGLVFDTANAGTGGVLAVDLSSLLRLPYSRIAIIQDVTGSDNQGRASYKIDRSCAGVTSLPPAIVGGGGAGIITTPGGNVAATLTEGRFTVHSPNFANFGPGATYPAVARSVTSSVTSGCTVSVTISEVPSSCTILPGIAQTKTWTSGGDFDHFDFEFDIYCGRATPPPTTDGLPPPPGTGDSSGTSTGTGDTATTTTAPEAATDTVRLVARLLENGKIEFGLQQWQHDSSWSDRLFPRARLFPADTAVGRWLVSSTITLSVSDSATDFADDTHVRIIARKQSDGRVEFGLQQSDDGGTTWGEQLLPTRRYFPTGATALRWLGSSNITVDS